MYPKISIVTIVYNNKAGLEKTIQSVLTQTYSNIEYIIIDGGSTDYTVELIKNYSSKLAYWISEPDKGIYHAMNKGWKKTSGEYCLFLNSGDYLYHNEVIEQVAKELEQSSADIVYGDLYGFDEKQSWISEYNEPVSLYFFSHHFLPHPSTFFKRVILEKLSGYHEEYSIISDWAFYIKAFINGSKFFHIPIVVSSFYMKGISSNNGGKATNERIHLFNNEFAFLKNDFEYFDRLQHFNTSVLTRLALKISEYKIKLLSKKRLQ